MGAVFGYQNGKLLYPQNELRSSGYLGWGGEPIVMDTAHQHDDLELNLVVEGGAMTYLFNGEPVEVRPGSIAAFWAAFPHQLIANSATQAHWIHIPFVTLLGWRLSPAIVSRLLAGSPVVVPPSAGLATDQMSFIRWAQDLASDDLDLRLISLLEIEARVRRLALVAVDAPPVRVDAATPALSHVIEMVRFIAAHAHEAITVSEIASAAGLHPNYAMTQFRSVIGTTIVNYVTRCRVAEARRMLISTAAPISDVASMTGFGSVSRFYAAFVQTCGVPPAQYRRLHRAREDNAYGAAGAG